MEVPLALAKRKIWKELRVDTSLNEPLKLAKGKNEK